MSHGDDIRAIHARDDLSPDEKRALTYEVKGNAYRGIVAQVINRAWQDEDLTITVTTMEVDDRHRLVVWCEARRDATQLELDLPFIYINPPLVHQGEESPLVALRRIVAETVRRV